MPRHRIFVAKDAQKFSSAHMTVFPDGTKEPLHGHNFQVSLWVELSDIRLEKFVDMGLLKTLVQDQCDAWDNKLLLARENPWFRLLRDDAQSCEFELCGKSYRLPADEVLLLPMDNVVCETLALDFAKALVPGLKPVLAAKVITALEVTVTESNGQGGSVRLDETDLAG